MSYYVGDAHCTGIFYGIFDCGLNEFLIQRSTNKMNLNCSVGKVYQFFSFSDLEGIKTTAVRSAYSDPQQPPDVCYLKSDVEKR